MKMVQLKKHSTTNIQRPTSNGVRRWGHWMLDVGCWMLDVRGFGLCCGVLLAALGSVASFAQPNVVPATGTDFASFQIIGQRNIFDPNRVPHRRSGAAARVVDSFSFVGTLSYAKGTFAFFDGTGQDFRKVLELNGSIAGFKVAAITPKSVKLLSETNAISGTNEIVLEVGTQIRRNDDGQWEVSSEPAAYASTGSTFTSGSQHRASGRMRFDGSSRSSMIITGNLQTGDSNPSAPDGAPDAGTEMSAPETTPPAGGNDALARLMQRRAQEQQQLGQGQ